MPTLDIVNGIKISVYNGEHRPPHIHASYNEFEALFAITTKVLYAGELPVRQKRVVLDWLSENSEWAIEVFYELNPELK